MGVFEPEHHGKLSGVQIEVYSSFHCPDCVRLKRFLADEKIGYAEVDITEIEGAAERLEAATGKRGVPYLLINGQRWVRGYHLDQPGRFAPSVFRNELMAAL